MHVVVNLDKPKGITSQEAVTRVKKLFRAKKAGHAGTLDPLATGVLLVCLNESTKIAGYLAGLQKEYSVTLKLGERTDTYDVEGKVIERRDFTHVTESAVLGVLEHFRGEIEQSPPMYSAIKVSGSPLYKLARKGIVIERPKRRVTIHRIGEERGPLAPFDPPYVRLYVSCSSGTYVRSLVEDIGFELGCGAHVTELRRLAIGGFRVGNSATMEELPEKEIAVFSIDSALGHLKEVVFTEGEYSLARHGAPVFVRGGFRIGETLKLKDPAGRLFALGLALTDRVKVERLLHI